MTNRLTNECITTPLSPEAEQAAFKVAWSDNLRKHSGWNISYPDLLAESFLESLHSAGFRIVKS